MKIIAHGITNIGWMVEFDSHETDAKKLWNHAAEALEGEPSQVMEQVNRILAVHNGDQRCSMCPPLVEVTAVAQEEKPDEDGS